MLSHCLLYHGEVSQNYDKLADLQYPTNHLDGVRFVPLRRSPAISRRLRHHQSSTVILDYASSLLDYASSLLANALNRHYYFVLLGAAKNIDG